MRLYFLRHADALPGADDAVRPLSKLGQRQAKAVADMLHNAGVVFDAAYSSPLVRARETAEIVLPITNHEKRIILELTDNLLNEERNFAGWLKQIPEGKNILLVGHNPSISNHVARLLKWQAGDAFEMSKGMLASVRTEDRINYTLKLVIGPKMLGVK